MWGQSSELIYSEARIEGDHIVFRVPIGYLPEIALGAEDGGTVNDAAAFARDLVDHLNHEDEQGLCPFHRMFDGAVAEAINQGASGVEIEGE
ncbi:hypothetical protein D3273_24425 [Lichenibacterium minor]|uniref:Uncharacterized protein n=1 Tax=Lichenibacterium minor TaxID=2316528 RepID=A0A4Q2TZ02_9HYPH|nr:hypothetical protein [Lichenibacterium minor]RYC29342.1 hypothetical protein D3273_24425 [Lichenibacterium minor]